MEKSRGTFQQTIIWPSEQRLLNILTAPLQRDKHPTNKCPRYDTKQSDDEAPVILELWGMRSISSLRSLQVHSGPEW